MRIIRYPIPLDQETISYFGWTLGLVTCLLLFLSQICTDVRGINMLMCVLIFLGLETRRFGSHFNEKLE